MNCVGSIAATQDIPDEPSEFAAEGSVAHEIAARCLKLDTNAADYIGEELESDGFKFTVDAEMAEFVQIYVDEIREIPGEQKDIEELLDMLPVYGVDNQFGTGDTIILNTAEAILEVHDLKFGRGVTVYAEDNEQLYSYGAAAYKLYESVCDWKAIKVCIHQPRIFGHYDEYILTPAEIEAFILRASVAAERAMALIGADADTIKANLTPSPKGCRWCPLKDFGRCEALTNYVHKTVFDNFTDLSQPEELTVRDTIELKPEGLAACLDRLDIIAKWAAGISAAGLSRVKGGLELPGYKMVAGKKGSRAWKDKEAEEIMKAARIKTDVMYAKKLITPTVAEKLFEKSKPKIWNKLLAIITQSDGKPSLAPASDKRAAMVTAAAFEDVSGISAQDAEDFSDII